MRRIGVFLLFIMFCISIYAQTQQGIVKTPTRRNVNGTMTQGQYIPNATIAVMLVNNNTKQSHVSGNRGKFSFYAPSPYYITSVTAQKGSYTFLDADFAKKQRQYSNNVVEVLVDDPNVLAKVRDEAIAYERSKIRKQIRAKEDEIEALKEANKITTAEYNKMLGELSEYRKSSEAIVQQIAEVYATTDFDKMDDFNKKLLAFVEEGNFKSADSLLRTQGSKEELFEKIKKEEQAIKKTEDDVNRAKEYNNQEKEALARRLYSEHLMFLQKPLMQDSALYCLKMRADLDTTNVSWTASYADLCRRMHLCDEAIKYYKLSSENALQQGREDLSIFILSFIAVVYAEREQFDEEFKLLTDLIRRGDSINKSNPLRFNGIDFLYWNLANYYRNMNQFDKAVECLKKCNDIDRGIRRYTEVEKKYDRVESLSAIGSLYANMFMPKEALQYLLKSRELLDSIYTNYPNNRDRRYEFNIETHLGIAYEYLNEHEKALFHYQLSYNIQKDLYKIDPETYLPYIAEICKNIGLSYFNLGELDNSIK